MRFSFRVRSRTVLFENLVLVLCCSYALPRSSILRLVLVADADLMRRCAASCPSGNVFEVQVFCLMSEKGSGGS